MTEPNQDVKKNNSREINDLGELPAKSLIYKEIARSVILPHCCRQIERALTPVGMHFSQDFLQVIDFYRESLASDSGSVFCKSLIYKEFMRIGLPVRTLLPSGGP
jgi:hypothetical protein